MNAHAIYQDIYRALPVLGTESCEFDFAHVTKSGVWVSFKASYSCEDCGVEDDYFEGTGYHDLRSSCDIYEIDVQDENENPLPDEVINELQSLIQSHYEQD